MAEGVVRRAVQEKRFKLKAGNSGKSFAGRTELSSSERTASRSSCHSDTEFQRVRAREDRAGNRRPDPIHENSSGSIKATSERLVRGLDDLIGGNSVWMARSNAQTKVTQTSDCCRKQLPASTNTLESGIITFIEDGQSRMALR